MTQYPPQPTDTRSMFHEQTEAATASFDNTTTEMELPPKFWKWYRRNILKYAKKYPDSTPEQLMKIAATDFYTE